jgi:VanZ family protein
LNLCRIAAWCLAAAIIILSLVPADVRPETGAPSFLEHFVIYLATGSAFYLGYPRRPFLLGILLIAFAASVEIVQLWVPGRHARLSDFIIDAVALNCGAGIDALVGRIGLRV